MVMQNKDVLRLLRSINDIVLGAQVNNERLDDIEKWLRLEEEHGAGQEPAVQAIIVALVRELKDCRSSQMPLVSEGKVSSATEIDPPVSSTPVRPGTGSRKLKNQPIAETPAETEAEVSKEMQSAEEPVLAGVGAEDAPKVEAPAPGGEW